MIFEEKFYQYPLQPSILQFCDQYLRGERRSSDQAVVSRYSVTPTAVFHPLLVYAYQLRLQIEQGHGAMGYAYSGDRKKKHMLLEYETDGRERILVDYAVETGRYRAAIYTNSNGVETYLAHPVVTGDASYQEGIRGEALVLPFLFLEDPEMESCLERLKNPRDSEDEGKAMLLLCSNVSSRMAKNDINTGLFAMNQQSRRILRISQNDIAQPEYRVHTLVGKFAVFQTDGASALCSISPEKKLSGISDFRLGIEIRDEDKELIPALPDNFDIPAEALEIAALVRDAGMKRFMLIGKAGTGKTTMAPMIAQLLGLPYRYFTCSDGTDEQQLIANFIPATGEPHIDLPTYMDLVNDPSTAYCTLTGVYDEDITGEEVLRELVRQASAKNRNFVEVESELVKACRYPSVIEIQEPTMISRPGVLSALNALLDDAGTITSITGETIHCNPHTVFILTTNPGYRGCHALNEAVIDRMDMVYEIEMLSPERMADRGMKATGFPDKQLAISMAQVVCDIDQYCDTMGITGAVCTYRGYKNWLAATKALGNPQRTIMSTVLTKVSDDAEIRKEIMASIVEAKLAA